MADVFLALVEGPAGAGFAKLAVVKRLRTTLADDPEFVAMLIDEARITARLNHPNVVQMLEVGVEGEEYFLAMEYLDGQPLHRLERRVQRTGKTIGRDAQIALFNDVLAGLHHAHELVDYDGTPLNVVHRDITPHNIFLTYDGQVKVVDFGIAKAAGRAQETQHGVVKGKVRYMAPEQALGLPVDRRADIFAVGLLLWQAATGKRFWGDQDDFAIVQALIAGEYQPSPRAVNPEVPEELDRICRRALSLKPEDRYMSALDMRVELEAFLGPAALDARRSVVSMLNELFAKERRELRGIIEKVGRETVAPHSIQLLSQHAAASSGTVSVVSVSSGTLSPVTAERRSIAPHRSVAPSAPLPPPRGGRFAISASIVVAAAAIASAVAFGFGLESGSRVAAASPAVVAPQVVRLEQTPVRIRAVAPFADVSEWRATGALSVAAPPPPPAAAPPPPPPPSASVAKSFAAPPAAPTIAPPSARANAQQRGGRLSLDAADPWSAKN